MAKEKKKYVRNPLQVTATLNEENFKSAEERAVREDLPLSQMVKRLIAYGMKYDDQLQEELKEFRLTVS